MFPIAFNTLFEYLVTRVLASHRFPAEMEMTLVKSLHKTIKHVLPDYLVTERDLLVLPSQIFGCTVQCFITDFQLLLFFFPPAVPTFFARRQNNSGNNTVSYLWAMIL